ncbi:hypothetical protein GCM10027614_26770 [Micromonospora vulcania]
MLDDPLGGGLLAAEVTARPPDGHRAGPRADHFDAGHQLLHRGDHGLERPGVPAGVVLHDGELRAAALRLPLAQPSADPLGAGLLGAGDHPVGVQHGDRTGGRHPVDDLGSEHRPVRAPQQQGAYRRTGHAEPTRVSAGRLPVGTVRGSPG